MKSKHSAMECFRNYRFHSIFWKNLLLISCVVLLPFLCALLISGYTYDELQRNEKQTYSDALLTRATMEVNSLFDDAEDTAIRTAFDEDVRSFIHGTVSARATLDIVGNLSNVKIFREEIENICLYNVSGSSVLSPTGKNHYNNYRDKAAIDYWEPEGGMIQIRYLPADSSTETGERIAFYFRPGYAKGEKTGCIIITYDLQKLADKFDYGDDVKLVLLHEQQILFSSDGILQGEFVANPQMLLHTEESNIAVSGQLEHKSLRVILHVNSQTLYMRLGHIRLTSVMLLVVALLATVGVVFYISRKIFDPISDLLALLEEHQNLEEDSLIQTKDEIAHIHHVMNSTISKNKDIEEELSRRLKLLKKAQAVALQAQINPHFMYNTIDTINWMAIRKIGKGNEVSQMLNILSQLLRYSLGNTDTFVSLEEEINYTKKYLQVQQIRSSYGFDVIWDIPEELGKCNAIKMILQPVVENAIKYGIKPFGDGGVVEIRAIRANDAVHIFVSDSGVGLTQEETDEINRVINSQVIKESDHIGLSNVNQRINLMFGDEYGVTVSSKINEGTTVELTIPYLQEKKP